MDDKGASACINALQYNLGDYWQGTLLHRYYTLNYRQLHASSISESSGMQGEEGVMLQIDGQPLRYWQVQGMIDLFKFSQPQYGIRDSTSQGFEATLRLLYQHNRLIGRSTNATFGYRIKKKGDYYRHTFDGVLTLQPHSSLSLKTQLRGRIHSLKNQDPTYGYAVSQSVGWQSSHWAACPFSIVAQACYFHTEDYNSRIYLTERTILYGFGLPMLYGEGVRYSLTGTLAIGSQCHIDLKWALTNYANRATISSGLQQISGNTQQDVWLQLRLKI